MPKSRKDKQSESTSVPSEGRSIVIGGDVTYSNVILGDNNSVNFYPGRQHLTAERIAQLTEEYRRAVEREWSTLRVNEAEIPLKDVFVMLQAVASPPPKNLDNRPEIAELPERMSHAGFEPKEIPPVPVELSEALKEAQQVVLLGEPGSGKSTTLQFIGLCFVHANWAEDRLQLTEKRIPIKLDLRGFADILAEPGTAIEEALGRAVREVLRNISHEDAHELIQTWRDRGQLLLLFDGLDEVSDQLRRSVSDGIYKFSSWQSNRQCRLVVSSRLAGYSAIGGEFKDFTLKPFEHAEEVIPYLQSWLAVLRTDWGPEQVQAETVNLHQRMNSQPSLRRVLDNPLLLRISAQVYARDEQIATNRADLYRRHTEELWIRALERGVDRAKKDAVWRSIEDLAWALQTDNAPSISAEMEIIIREKMGLLARIGERLAFSHTTLQEYFVAKRLARAWLVNQAGAWTFLRPRLHVAIWQEPLLLLGGILNSEKARDLVKQVMNAHSPFERRLKRDTILALSIIGEGVFVDDQLQHMLFLKVRWAFSYWRRVTGEFLYREDRHELIAALGKMGNTALHELRIALKDRSDDIRWFAVQALGELKAKETISDLREALEDREYLVRMEVVQALGEMNTVETLPILREVLYDRESSMRKRAIEALSKMGKEALPELYEAQCDANWEVSLLAIGALGKIGEASMSLLRWYLKNSYWEIRREAASVLGKIGKSALPEIYQALEQGDIYLRIGAIQALGEIKAVETVPILRQALKDPQTQIRRVAARALGEMKAVEALPELLRALKDSNEYVQQNAITALVELKSKEALPDLLQALKSNDSYLRWEATKALGKLGEDALLDLHRALNNRDWFVHWGAIKALSKMKPEYLPMMRKALKASNRQMNNGAVEILNDFIPTITISSMRKSQSKNIYQLQAIAKIKDISPSLRKSIAERLAALQAVASPYQDPFAPVKPSLSWRILRFSLASLAIIFVLGLLAVLGILCSATADVFNNLLGPTLSAWIQSHPVASVLIFISLGMAIGLLTWSADKLKDAFGGK